MKKFYLVSDTMKLAFVPSRLRYYIVNGQHLEQYEWKCNSIEELRLIWLKHINVCGFVPLV